MKKISQTKIARLAGVSQCTVSRVLHGTVGVNIETREKILAVLRANNYRSAETLPVVVMSADVSTDSVYETGILSAITRELDRRGIAFEVLFRNNVKLLLSRSAAGILSLCYDHSFEREISGLLSIPIVGINTSSNFQSEIFSVCSDEVQGMELACRKLYEQGHRNIGCLCCLASEEYSQKLRKQEFRKQCEKLNVNGRTASITANPGRDIRNMLKHSVTGIIIASEEWSYILQKALTDEKLKVPEDVSIITWAERKDWGIKHLNLCSMCQNYDALAREAVKMLMNQIKHNPIADKKITIPYIYTHRGSVGPIGPIRAINKTHRTHKTYKTNRWVL